VPWNLNGLFSDALGPFFLFWTYLQQGDVKRPQIDLNFDILIDFHLLSQKNRLTIATTQQS